MSNYQHWHIEKDHKNIIWLGFDRQDARVNTINSAVLDELNHIIKDIEKQSDIKGLILYSAKDKGFIAGADVHAISQLKNPKEAVAFLQQGQTVLARLEALPIPTVAMINGFCMGGGLELALACDYRIATDTPDTRIGLPEILLGIHPGWGGTVRLPKLIGGFNALSQVMLTGRGFSANHAKALGMIDDAVPLRQLKRAAVFYITKKPEKHQPTQLQKLTNIHFARTLLAKVIRHKVAQKVRATHYPAPFALIDLWEKEGQFNERAYLKEIDSVEHLIAQGETSANLIRAFLLREQMKSFTKDSTFRAMHVHVIGAGVMGGDIAAFCAQRGLRVTLQDQSIERIAPAIARASKYFNKKLKKPRLVRSAMDRLIPDVNGDGLHHADVIIEAVFENLEVKQTLFKHIEKTAKKTAIIASNTSSIPLDEISAVMKHPERLVGIHFFNPVAQMELVEVVHSEKTAATVMNDACAFVGQIGKLPLPVRSSPGFLVNRVLMPYLMECVQLLEEGHAPESIDEAALNFGMMMGPVELADTVGMDVCLAVAKNLTAHFGGTIPQKLIDMVAAGKLGRKSGEGFYVYKQGKPIKQKVIEGTASEDIANRLIMRMVNEAAACLREGVVENSDLLDAGLIFGAGFAPFRGGPMHYAAQFGKNKLNQLFSQLETQHGVRFKADLGLE